MKYYREFKFIPIFNFFEIYESKDIRYLLKLDDYSELPDLNDKEILILTEAIEKISNEYTEKTKDSEYDPILDCKKEITLFQLKKNRIHNILQILRLKYHPGLVIESDYLEQEIRNAGYKLEYTNKQEFYKALGSIPGATKGINYRIEAKKEELKNLEGDVKEVSYMNSVIAIEEGLGIKINIYKDTMMYYITCLKRLKEKAEKIKEYNDKIKNKAA